MTSPLYRAEMLRLVPDRVVVSIACAVAYPLELLGLPETSTGLPSAEPLFRSCIVPVGATPLLEVKSVAVTVITVPNAPEDGTPLIDVAVVA